MSTLEKDMYSRIILFFKPILSVTFSEGSLKTNKSLLHSEGTFGIFFMVHSCTKNCFSLSNSTTKRDCRGIRKRVCLAITFIAFLFKKCSNYIQDILFKYHRFIQREINQKFKNHHCISKTGIKMFFKSKFAIFN